RRAHPAVRGHRGGAGDARRLRVPGAADLADDTANLRGAIRMAARRGVPGNRGGPMGDVAPAAVRWLRVRRARFPLAHLARFAVAVRLADKRGKRVFSNQPTQVVESPAAAPDPAGRARDAPRRRWDRCRGKPPGACAADGREATVSRSNVVLALTLAAV